MRTGKFFQIPEGPADIECLWRRAIRVPLPSWLAPAGPDAYRYAGSAVCHDHAGRQRYLSELADLEAAGLVVDEDARDPEVCHVWVSRPTFEQVWSIGIYAGPSPFRLGPPDDIRNPVLTREDVTDVRAAFVADPFMLEVDGQWHMFFEVMNWRTGKGEIGLATSADGHRWTYRQIVLAESFHVSYPYVFAWMNDIFMIPESHQAGAVRLYRAEAFPTRWSFVATLISAPYVVDASVCRYDDRWWLFAETNPDMTHDTLRLYYADHLVGPWREHPASPIIRGDAGAARPAGRVLVLDGRPVRFGQSCEPSYGGAVRAFKITQLTTTTYAEHEVGLSVLTGSGGGWNAAGMHHLDAHPIDPDSWLACVDGWTAPPETLL